MEQTKTITVRTDIQTIEKFRCICKHLYRSPNKQMIRLIRQFIAKYENSDEKDGLPRASPSQ